MYNIIIPWPIRFIFYTSLFSSYDSNFQSHHFLPLDDSFAILIIANEGDDNFSSFSSSPKNKSSFYISNYIILFLSF